MHSARLLLQKISLFFCIATALWGAGPGGTGDALLRAPLGATAASLGGAGSARPGVAVTHWNPAASALLDQSRLSLGNRIRPLGRYESYLSWDAPMRRRGMGGGALFRYSRAGGLDSLRDENGDMITGGESFSLVLDGSISLRLSGVLSAGLAAGWAFNRLPSDYEGGTVTNRDYSGFSGATVFLLYTGLENYSISAGLRDLFLTRSWSAEDGGSGVFYTIEDRAWTKAVLGVARHNLGTVTEFTLMSDAEVYAFHGGIADHPFALIDLGADWNFAGDLSLRFGVADILLNGELFDRGRDSRQYRPSLTAGAGYVFRERIGRSDLLVDYAFRGSGAGAGFDHSVDVSLLF
ncbi:MAG: hypothetical protein ACQEQV_04990 [Fibrobacterota bacterium]